MDGVRGFLLDTGHWPQQVQSASQSSRVTHVLDFGPGAGTGGGARNVSHPMSKKSATMAARLRTLNLPFPRRRRSRLRCPFFGRPLDPLKHFFGTTIRESQGP